MANLSAKNKHDFLGMPHGTAAHQLRKQILFSYIQAAGDDVCFKCGEQIQTADALSIEHKLPWLGNDPKLFWDLDNISFSHLSCNRPHSFPERPGGRKERTAGMNWCYRCQALLPTDVFSPSKYTFNKLRGTCKPCAQSHKKPGGYSSGRKLPA